MILKYTKCIKITTCTLTPLKSLDSSPPLYYTCCIEHGISWLSTKWKASWYCCNCSVQTTQSSGWCHPILPTFRSIPRHFLWPRSQKSEIKHANHFAEKKTSSWSQCFSKETRWQACSPRYLQTECCPWLSWPRLVRTSFVVLKKWLKASKVQTYTGWLCVLAMRMLLLR